MNNGTYQIESYIPKVDNECEIKVCNKEKDLLICQLKSRIHQLEQQEKDYELLNQKFNQLQNEYQLAKENKLRLEYELKQRDETYNEKICDLRGENENLQLGFDEKISVGEKLLADNNTLSNQFDMKNAEISDLNNKISELTSKLHFGLNDKSCLEQKIKELTDDKNNQKVEIDQLFEDNKRLSKIRQEQELNIKIGEDDRMKLSKKIEQNNNEINNLNNCLSSHLVNIEQLQNKLDHSSNLNCNLQNTMKDFERQICNIKNENENLKNNIFKEKNMQNEEAKKNQDLNLLISDVEKKIMKINQEYEQGKKIHQQIACDNDGYQIENNKLKDHIKTLTCQNQKLMDELENVLIQDENMNGPLARREKIALLLKNNKISLNQSMKCLNDFELMKNCDNNVNTNKRTTSPFRGLTYSRGINA